MSQPVASRLLGLSRRLGDLQPACGRRAWLPAALNLGHLRHVTRRTWAESGRLDRPNCTYSAWYLKRVAGEPDAFRCGGPDRRRR